MHQRLFTYTPKTKKNYISRMCKRAIVTQYEYSSYVNESNLDRWHTVSIKANARLAVIFDDAITFMCRLSF